jgi:hypothetical protein
MSFLEKVTVGRKSKPHLILVYGPDGVGKTSFGAGAPNPIFLGTEDGTDFLDVARFPSPANWLDVIESIKELISKEHQFKTLVIDSLDWLEPLLWRQICEDYKVKSIELAAGGFGKGYVEATERWCKFMQLLNILRARKSMNVILIAHCETKPYNDAQLQVSYDRYQLKLDRRASPKFREWVDAVLFANYEIYTQKDGNSIKAFGEGGRKLWTEGRPGFDAKNRMGLKESIDLDFGAYQRAYNEAIEVGPTADQIIVRINDLLSQDSIPPELKEAVNGAVEKASKNQKQLLFIEKRLQDRLNLTLKEENNVEAEIHHLS